VAVERIFGAQPATPAAGTMLSLETLEDLTARRDRLQVRLAAARESEGPTWAAGLGGLALGLATGYWLI